MTHRIREIAAAVVLLFAAHGARAQHFTASYQLGSYADLGHPGTFQVARVEPSVRGVRGLVEYSPTHKYNGSGYSYKLGIAALALVGPFHMGGGVDYGRTVTDEWAKDTTRPFVEVRWRTLPGEMYGRYRFRGTDSANGLRAVEFGAAGYPHPHIGFVIEVRRVWFHTTGLPGEKQTGWVWQIGPQVRF